MSVFLDVHVTSRANCLVNDYSDFISFQENEVERNVKALKGLLGASSGELPAERGVDEFDKRRRMAVAGLSEP